MTKTEVTCPHCGKTFPVDYKYLLLHLVSKAGKARMAKLTPEQRSELAKKAANKRWSNK